MTKLILSILLLLLLFVLAPVALWFGVRWGARKTSLKAYSGWIASFIIILLPALFFYNLFKGRDGDEIYRAAFKSKRPYCVKIISYKDARIPVLDNDIRMHFRTCPQEMERILLLEEYQKYNLGDTVWYFLHQHNGGGTEIYMRFDSTEADYVDYDF